MPNPTPEQALEVLELRIADLTKTGKDLGAYCPAYFAEEIACLHFAADIARKWPKALELAEVTRKILPFISITWTNDSFENIEPLEDALSAFNAETKE